MSLILFKEYASLSWYYDYPSEVAHLHRLDRIFSSILLVSLLVCHEIASPTSCCFWESTKEQGWTGLIGPERHTPYEPVAAMKLLWPLTSNTSSQ